MKYSRGQFTEKFYELWQLGLHLPIQQNAMNYSVKYKASESDEYSRVTLKAVSVSDALERACFAVSHASLWRPEDIDLHAVYDADENLLWIDESFYEVVQKKNEFRGIERREFLKRFGTSSAAILFGFRPSLAHGLIPFGFLKQAIPKGSQIYTSGSGNWTAPFSAPVSVLCIGAGGGGSQVAGGGGGLGYNTFNVISGTNYAYSVGVGGYSRWDGPDLTSGGHTTFSTLTAYGGNVGSRIWSGPAIGTGGSYSGGLGGGTGGTGGQADGRMNWPGGGGSGGYNVNGGTGASNLLGSYSGQTAPANAGAGGKDGSLEGKGVGIYGIGDSTPTTYGGGGMYYSNIAGNGVIRIIWGSGRSYPNNAT